MRFSTERVCSIDCYWRHNLESRFCSAMTKQGTAVSSPPLLQTRLLRWRSGDRHSLEHARYGARWNIRGGDVKHREGIWESNNERSNRKAFASFAFRSLGGRIVAGVCRRLRGVLAERLSAAPAGRRASRPNPGFD